MKKILLFPLALALAACGGGHGGGGAVDVARVTNTVDVRASNAMVTPMVSNSEYQVTQYVAGKIEGVVDSNDLSRSALVRGRATHIDYVTASELIDLAQWLVDSGTSQEDIVAKFNNSSADKNRIKAALKLLNDMECFVGGDAEETAQRIVSKRDDFALPLANLISETEVLNLRDTKFKTMVTPGHVDSFKFFVDGTGKITGIAFVEGEEGSLRHIPQEWLSEISRTGGNTFQKDSAVMNYESYARTLGLKYADFGVISIDYSEDNGVSHFDAPFIAGYQQKEIATMPDGETVFTGIAKGTVEYAGAESSYLPIVDESATLTYDNATNTTTLAADFANWYDVSIVKHSDDSIDMNLNTAHTSDTRYTLDGANPTVKLFDAAFYGDNNVPSEANALFQYQEKIDSENPNIENNNKTLYIGFGGTNN